MASYGTTPLPRTAVVPLAVSAARRAKLVSIVAAALCATCLIIGLADAFGGGTNHDRDDAAAAIWVGIFALVAGFAVWRARRVTAAAARAASDTGSTWTLVGRLVVALDDRGQPVQAHSFKITRGEHVRLLADLPKP